MLGGAYSYQNMERQHVDTIKTLAENEKHDAIARARKLSIETNKRRRALAIKRKAEAEKEERRRKQILTKRRDRQNEATERFQRGHISSSRPPSGTSSARWSPRHSPASSRLDEALKLVRGSPSSSRGSSAKSQANQGRNSPNGYYRQNSDPLSKPYFNKYAHPSINTTLGGYEKKDDLHSKSLRNLKNSRNLFEQQLQTHQQSLLSQQQRALQDFNQQVMQEIEVDRNVVNVENHGGAGERTDSLTSQDSLEETDSNDTLRESCDIDRFVNLQNGEPSDRNVNSMNNSRTGYQYVKNQTNEGNVSYAASAGNHVNQTIDSYSSQAQQPQPGPGETTAAQDARRQQYYARQLEIQAQLQEQQQQKQQEELERQVWEQQQKQKVLAQQQHDRQQHEERERQRHAEAERRAQEELREKQRQQAEALERQRAERLKHQQMIEKAKLQEEHMQRLRQEAENQRQQLQQQQQQAAQGAQQPSTNTQAGADTDSSRPKVQMKAWATPSPHPPTPSSATASTPLVTNASPYTGKPTHTNMTTTTVGGYDKANTNSVRFTVPTAGQTSASDTNVSNTQTHKTGKTVTIKTDPSQDQPNLSFLESVTRDLTGTTNNVNNPATAVTVPHTKASDRDNKASMSSHTETSTTNTNSVKPSVSPAVGKTSTYYKGSYGAQYAAKQGGNTSGRQNGGVGFDDRQLELIAAPGLTGDDTADTDSVSTICEEKEPEPKEIKGILKRAGSAGSAGKKSGGILKKAGSTGNMDIRDSLEITRVHLTTPADEREQRLLRERAQNQPTPPAAKKNVRFADLCYYNDESEDSCRDEEGSDLFVKRKDDSDTVSHKPPRPVSAVALKTNSIQMNAKQPRAASASTLRTSTIPRAKTQVVRPQATAHIITQGNQGGATEPEPKKKVTIVNNDFMQKIPSMVRNNQTLHTVTPAAVYSATTASQPRPQEQKVNYAVSSVIMPKSNSAPFIYPGYPNNKGLAPTGSVDGPSEANTNSKYDGAMFDENGLRIDRTPTDDEINFLWDKLKSCLSRNTNGDKSQADGHRQAAPVSNTYIDGNALGQYNSLNRVAQPQVQNGLRKQNSLDSAAGSTYAKRYGLLQQRRQQPNPNSLKSRQAGAQGQQALVAGHSDPPQATGVPGQDVSESMAGFLVAEQLSEQSLTDSAIHQAIEDAQARQQSYNSGRPQVKVPTALSLEEQHVLESLDRLNEKLKVSDVPLPNGNAALAPVPRDQQPPPQQQQQQQQQQQPNKQVIHMGGFKGHTPISQRRVIESATHKARLRITSAALKRNVHRTQ